MAVNNGQFPGDQITEKDGIGQSEKPPIFDGPDSPNTAIYTFIEDIFYIYDIALSLPMTLVQTIQK